MKKESNKVNLSDVWLFDEYRKDHYPCYLFKWKKAPEQIEINPSRFIYEGTLYEASKGILKPCHYILTLDMLIALPTVEKTKNVRQSLSRTIDSYYLKLINPRLQKISFEGKPGLRLVSDNLAQTFLCKSKEDMLNWFKALKRVSILENIKESYELKQFIGLGGSAMVRIGKRINEEDIAYAIKSFPKKNYTDKVYSFVSVLLYKIEDPNQ